MSDQDEPAGAPRARRSGRRTEVVARVPERRSANEGNRYRKYTIPTSVMIDPDMSQRIEAARDRLVWHDGIERSVRVSRGAVIRAALDAWLRAGE